MSKAKDKAEDAYLDYFLDGRLRNCSRHEAFIYGYCQAEKDLELSWKDMECIIKHYQDIMAEKSRVSVRVEDYQELLKRFKNMKDGSKK